MLRVELIFFRRCLFLLPIFVFAGTVNGQQFTSLNWEQNFPIVNRWIDPFFPLNIQHSIVNLEQEAVDKSKKIIQGVETMDKVDGHAVEISNIVVVHGRHRGDIKYSSSSSSGLYRVALDKQTDERYDGKPVFVDTKGIKYIIDSKYRKQFVK